METRHYDEREVTEWLSRLAVPAFAWAALFAFFAYVGWSVVEAPMQTAHVATAVSATDANVPAAPPTPAVNAVDASEPGSRDAAVSEHVALDPVGAGRSE